MTLAAQMAADCTDLVLNTDEHAESCTYTAKGSAPAAIAAIFERDQDIGFSIQESGRSEPATARVFCSTAAVPDPQRGDDLAVGDELWKIDRRLSRDGFGGQWLACKFVRRVTVGNDRATPT